VNTGPQYVSAGEAEKALGVERRTLIRWAEAGQIKFLRPGGTGHWRLDFSSVGQADPTTSISKTGPVKAIYARVSTRKQLPDLQNRIDALQAKYSDHVVFSDCASGLNFKRKCLLSLLQHTRLVDGDQTRVVTFLALVSTAVIPAKPVVLGLCAAQGGRP